MKRQLPTVACFSGFIFMLVLAVLFYPDIRAAVAGPPELTQAQKLELQTATSAVLRAENAMLRMNQEMQKAVQHYNEVVTKFQALAPGYQLTAEGKFEKKEGKK